MVAKGGFFYHFKVCILNAYASESYVQPNNHSGTGRNKRDVLSFRFDLARELIGGFCSHEKAGRPRSEVNTQFTSDRIKSQYQINSLIW